MEQWSEHKKQTYIARAEITACYYDLNVTQRELMLMALARADSITDWDIADMLAYDIKNIK